MNEAQQYLTNNLSQWVTTKISQDKIHIYRREVENDNETEMLSNEILSLSSYVQIVLH